jgi:hypothetical protein
MKISILKTKLFKFFLMIAILSLTSSCASIVSGKNQSVTIKTIAPNNHMNEVNNSTCKLINSKGEWYVQTPQSVFIRKSYGDISVNCQNNNMVGSKTFSSQHEAIVWGNVLLGGLIGFAIDAGTGSGFSYPQTMYVEIQ